MTFGRFCAYLAAVAVIFLIGVSVGNHYQIHYGEAWDAAVSKVVVKVQPTEVPDETSQQIKKTPTPEPPTETAAAQEIPPTIAPADNNSDIGMVEKSYVDVGGDDASYIVDGFRESQTFDENPCTIHGTDYTYRYQLMGQNNVLEIPVTPGQDLHLTLCVQRGVAQDQWTLYVNGCDIVRTRDERDGLPLVYDVVVPASCVDQALTRLNFNNRSTDGDGAAVYGVLYWQ